MSELAKQTAYDTYWEKQLERNENAETGEKDEDAETGEKFEDDGDIFDPVDDWMHGGIEEEELHESRDENGSVAVKVNDDSGVGRKADESGSVHEEAITERINIDQLHEDLDLSESSSSESSSESETSLSSNSDSESDSSTL